MKQIVITLDSSDILSLEKQGDKEALVKASHESIEKQIEEGILQIKSSKESSGTEKESFSFGLIIDGRSLEYSLGNGLEKSFFKLA
ncbi:phospholipid-transporting ATPase 8-like, partial [Trifolium medium]|nr:phospholipid-transporting ATPase 8-like [Trifolium medium]